jgi:ankyrin repeat protein
MKTCTALLLGLAIGIAFAGRSVQTTAAMLPGGSAQDTALREAAIFRNIEGVKAALKKGANVNAPSNTGRSITPLGAVVMETWRMGKDRATELATNETAAKLSNGGMSDKEIDRYLAVEITKMLFAAGAKLGPYDREILYRPIADGNVELVGLLIDHGASVTGNLSGYTPTELAKEYDQEAVYDLLVSRGGIPVDTRSAAQIALVEAAGHGLLAALSGENVIAKMETALKQGADINGSAPDNYTPLIAALRMPIEASPQLDIIKWLLVHGAHPNQKGESGFKGIGGLPLHIFIASNKETLAGTVAGPLGFQARQLGVYDDEVARAFRNDVARMAEETLSLLLKAGAKVSGVDDYGKTPLHVAAQFDNLRAAEILIKEGAKVMPKDKQGETPLDYAESAAMIKLLKENGATER